MTLPEAEEKPQQDANADPTTDKMTASERRKQRKAEQAAAKKIEKDAKKQMDTSEPQADADAEGDEIDPTKYFENRKKMLSHAKATQGIESHPHKWQVSISIPKYVERYTTIPDGEYLADEEVSVAGRLMRIAGSGKALRFYDLVGEDAKIQVMASASHHDSACGEYTDIHNLLRRGDLVGIRGFPGKSKRGELSIFPRQIKLLSPCLQMLPTEFVGLKDQEVRYRRRYLDFLVNQKTKNIFVVRAQIIKHIRTFLEADGFVEVETPMMNLISGGANARPFITHHNELDTDFYMRVAPELYLKMLVVGGMDRVYEIGKVFRNEGIDLTHNPEFTMCEFYQAYADVYDLMDKTETLLHSMVTSIHKSPKIQYTMDRIDGQSKDVEIDFTPPYPRINMVEEIERCSGVTIPRPFDSDECVEKLVWILTRNGLDMPHPATAAKLFDKLCGFFIEDKIVNPTFIIEHPQLMSPLAKWHRSKPEVTERGELFVAGKEVCNFYTELNDSAKQRECFLSQAKAKSAGDDEVMSIDEEFCLALEHGLPPTAGWGIGIDRVTMFLTNSNNIREVILFPTMRPPPQQQLTAGEADATKNAVGCGQPSSQAV